MFFMKFISSEQVMTRDDELLRSILQEWEASTSWTHMSSTEQGSSEENDLRHFHVLMLEEGGLVARMKPGGNMFRITNQGHDFIAATRQSEMWEAVKAQAAKLPGAGVGIMAQIAQAFIMQKARDLGILP